MSPGNLKSRFSKSYLTIPLVLSLCIAILFIDLATPLGIADGISYVAVVLLTIWAPDRKTVYYAATIGIAFIVLGFYFSPKGEDLQIVVPNRVISVIGTLVAAVVILRYKRSEEAATKSREQMEAMFLHANEGIVILNTAGVVVLANPHAQHLFNCPEPEFKGKLFGEFIPDFSENRVNDKEPADKKREGTARKRGGNLFPVEFSYSQYTTSEGLFTVVFVLDITRRKADEAALHKVHHDLEIYAEELKRSNSELENFAYISSHDLQEPLRKIQSFGHRLKEMDGNKLGEQSADYLDRMLNAASRMQNLINDLLLFSRVTSRKSTFRPVHLESVLNHVLGDLEVAIEQSQARIEADLGGIVVEGDSTQLQQLFLNLLGNAIKFRRGNVAPVIRVHAELFEPPDGSDKQFVRILFEDNGIGFDEKYADRIFTIFQRLEGSRYNGSGIGLTICKKIVRHHMGHISVKSEPGKGSCFMVALPCTRQHPVTEEFISKLNSYEKQDETYRVADSR